MLAGLLKSDEQTKCEAEGDEQGATQCGVPEVSERSAGGG